MRTFLQAGLLFLLFSSSCFSVAESALSSNWFGVYSLHYKGLDPDLDPYYIAELELYENGSLLYRDEWDPGKRMPMPACQGTYELKEVLTLILDCSVVEGPSFIQQKWDLQNTTLSQLESEEGAEWVLYSSLLPHRALKFQVRKRTSPLWPR